MNAGLPEPPRPSLVARLREVRIGQLTIAGNRRAAAAVALLLIAAPALTLAGAALSEMRVRDDIARIERRSAGSEAARDDRILLAALVARSGVGATIEGLARALPGEASLVSAARDAGGRLRIEAATADPDRLRVALRRDPATRMLRDAGQRDGDGAIVVTLDGAR